MSATPQTDIRIRWGIDRDLIAIDDIEYKSFENPWSREKLRCLLKEHDSIVRIAEVGGAIVGYIFYRIELSRIHVRRISVDPDYRRMKVGSWLMEAVMFACQDMRRDTIIARVPEELLDCQLFLRANHFKANRPQPGQTSITFIRRSPDRPTFDCD